MVRSAFLTFLLLATAMARADGPAGTPFTTDDQQTLIVQKVKALTELDLRPGQTSEYHLSLEGIFCPADGTDAVAISSALTGVEAIDVDGKAFLAPQRVAKEDVETRFAVILDGQAPIELRNLALTRSAYAMRSLKVAANMVVADARATFDADAKVGQAMSEAAPGLQLRVETLRIRDGQRMDISLEFRRKAAGAAAAGGALIDSVTVLDTDGNILGKSHFTRDNPFLQKGKLGAEMVLRDGVAKTIRVGLVTQPRIVPLTFKLTGLLTP